MRQRWLSVCIPVAEAMHQACTGLGAFVLYYSCIQFQPEWEDAEGAATAVLGTSPDADLVVTQSAETWEATFRGILSFPEALQSGVVQVNDFKALETFGTLFPMVNP
jgi:hypothetical protein